LETSIPDVLLLDFAMPGMSGAEVADRVRIQRPDLPIVFASGHSDTAAIERAVGPLAVLLRKPFRVDDLEAARSAA
jgi:CheY-like chemotaxis protein